MKIEGMKKRESNGVLGRWWGSLQLARGRPMKAEQEVGPLKTFKAMEVPRQGPMWRKGSLQHLPASKLLSSDILQGAWHTSTAFRRNIMSNWALPRQWHDRDSTEVSGVWFSSSVALKLWTYESGCSLDCGLCIPWEGALLPRGLVHTQSSLEQQIPAPEGGKASLVLGAERLGPLLQFGRYRGQIVCSIGHLIRCQMQL